MFLSFLFDEKPFTKWTYQHLWPIVIAAVILILGILWSKWKLNQKQQKQLLFIFSIFPFLAWIANPLTKLSIGTFNLEADLPLHICRLLAIFSPWVYWKQNKFWMGVFYFWIIVGTTNAIVTPELKQGAFHWEYITYFVMHLGLIILPIYNIVIKGHRIYRKDLWNAFWMANLLLVITFISNLIIGSNYMYTKAKPTAASMLDFMGPWPWYLLSTQFLALFLFSIAYIPFAIYNKKRN